MARFDKFTTPLQTALAEAQSLAVGLNNQFIEPLHLLKALLDQDGGTTYHLLSQGGVNISKLRERLNAALDRLPKVQGAEGELHISNDLSRLLNVADKLSQERGDAFISSEMFILATLQDKGELGRIFRESGGNEASIKQAIENVRGGDKVNSADAEDQRQALEKYTIDLTATR